MAEIARRLLADGPLGEATAVDFTYRHDCHVTAPDAEIAREMTRAAEAAGLTPRIEGLAASSDAWLYANQLGIPTILFGAGRLSDAHSSHEMVRLEDIDRAAVVLREVFIGWCGAA